MFDCLLFNTAVSIMSPRCKSSISQASDVGMANRQRCTYSCMKTQRRTNIMINLSFHIEYYHTLYQVSCTFWWSWHHFPRQSNLQYSMFYAVCSGHPIAFENNLRSHFTQSLQCMHSLILINNPIVFQPAFTCFTVWSLRLMTVTENGMLIVLLLNEWVTWLYRIAIILAQR